MKLVLRDDNHGEKQAVPVIRATNTERFDEIRHGECTLYRDDWKVIEDDMDQLNDYLVLEGPSDDVIVGRFDDDE